MLTLSLWPDLDSTYKQYQRRVGMFWPPITIVKGVWLALTARKAKVDRAVWGIGGGQKMKKL